MADVDKERWLRQAPDLVGRYEALQARYQFVLALARQICAKHPEVMTGHAADIIKELSSKEQLCF
jgi:hypothetical protein